MNQPVAGALSLHTKNFAVAGTLALFVGGVYAYTMRAVGGHDDLGDAIQRVEEKKKKRQLVKGRADGGRGLYKSLRRWTLVAALRMIRPESPTKGRLVLEGTDNLWLV
eukprot:TRINITY_DN328_c0_g1_i2.p2 TRINITY_DN328_c0_g1~~TRINITY_DN328_c0_g1_i2.p2  ORF type:complete len:108 (+),score=14.45 TRINITY_DN328_c0_g1_i2:708-1031(+)